MNKRDIQTDILRQIPVAHSIPKRLQPLFYSVLSSYGIKAAEPSEQLLMTEIAYNYCRLQDCKDMTRLFGTRNWLPENGKPITTLIDNRDKHAELEMVPALQKSLINLISALRDGQKRSGNHEALDTAIDRIKRFDRNSGLDRID